MTTEVAQVGDKQEDNASFDLESLKRELWVRVLGMEKSSQSQTSAQDNSAQPTPGMIAATGVNH